MSYPTTRLRRLRRTEQLRRMLRETVLTVDDFICPLFVIHGSDKKLSVPSMPGVYQFSVDKLHGELEELRGLGIGAVLLFGIPDHKDATGSASWDDNGIVQQAIRAIKKLCPDMVVITDVCLCEYTDHGHCGVVTGSGAIENDPTLELLSQQALSHARAGCDMVAPSDMMDGRVGAIRRALDSAGYADLPIMSYAAKYCSALYGPFRDAAGSAPAFGDRRTYQMDFRNSREALREVAFDIEEGADIVMVKPALAYLDILKAVKEKFSMPTAAYQVSGEYAMVKAAGANGWINGEAVMMETLTAIKRAGADLIITYFAKDAAKLLR
jgi:porphobilinogen synthase